VPPLSLAPSECAEGSPPSPPDIWQPSRLTNQTLRGCNGGTKIARGRRSTRPPRVASTKAAECAPSPAAPPNVAPQSGRPHSGGLPDRAPGSLVKDPGSKRQDAHTQLVWAAKTSRNTTQRCEAQRLLASLGGFGTALLSRSDIPTCPLPSTLRGTLASGPKTGVNRGPHPPPGVCPRPNQNTPTKSPRRE